MHIVLMGQGPFGARVLEELASKGETVAGIYTTADRRGEPLREVADTLDLPVFRPTSLRDRDVYADYTRLAPDLLVMAFVTEIVPERYLTYPRLGAIQYHPSLLPRHRGGSAINWAIIQGETRTGFTIFWPDRGIDTGPILLQKEVPISPDDTVGSLYFNSLFPLGVEALLEAVTLVKQGKAPRMPQDESQATYEGLCTEAASIIDWSRPAQEVYDLIRGTDPQPGATTYWQGRKLKLFAAELLPGPKGRPGQVVNVDDSGIVIATENEAIRVKRVRPEGAAKMGAAEYAASAGLGKGDQFHHSLLTRDGGSNVIGK